MGFLTEANLFSFPRFTGDHFLSEEERKQLTVLFNRLFPPDHARGIPGASDAKASRFVSLLLALDEEEYYQITDWRKAYRDGLKHLDAAAKDNFGTPLSALSEQDAQTLLSWLEVGKLEGLPEDFDQRGYFRMLLEHCIKGCFADPRWGGNDNGVMWRWLGWVQPAEDIRFEDD